ncbi:hypothetical protein BDB00DRAFT_873248 [Zychaea mexicana]|uniref:uncharacterized protein n=1 Tax=Zychaea mexicana TaxID=64656 RepID=UPI0022FEBE8B|nr:uncharacterized protein BDB00DRAFT_873248 [Zychaea mexicana]KAI9492504.1 hypothetical protein BDB00DRAFT_873248 [Zychaea mexicana]
MSSNNNTPNNSNTDARRQQHAQDTELGRINASVLLLQDSYNLQAENTMMRQQLASMSTYLAQQQQQPTSMAAPDVDRRRVEEVLLLGQIHARHSRFSSESGYRLDEDFRSAHNKLVTKIIIDHCNGEGDRGCVLGDKALRAKVHQYFCGQRDVAKRSPEQRAAIALRSKRGKRKAKERKVAHTRYLASLDGRYLHGERLLRRECMSPELSDGEASGVLRVCKPSFRNSKVDEFFRELDVLIDNGKKKKVEKKERRPGPVFEAVLEEKVLDNLPAWAK